MYLFRLTSGPKYTVRRKQTSGKRKRRAGKAAATRANFDYRRVHSFQEKLRLETLAEVGTKESHAISGWLSRRHLDQEKETLHQSIKRQSIFKLEGQIGEGGGGGGGGGGGKLRGGI